MKDIIIALCLLFTVPSVIQFWIFFMHLEITKQVKLGGKNG